MGLISGGRQTTFCKKAVKLLGEVSNPLVFGVARSKMTRSSLVTPQSELRRPLRDTVRSNSFNVAKEYAADSRS